MGDVVNPIWLLMTICMVPFVVSVNEKAAKAQGVTIPADLLSQAVNKF